MVSEERERVPVMIAICREERGEGITNLIRLSTSPTSPVTTSGLQDLTSHTQHIIFIPSWELSYNKTLTKLLYSNYKELFQYWKLEINVGVADCWYLKTISDLKSKNNQTCQIYLKSLYQISSFFLYHLHTLRLINSFLP